MPSMFVGAGLLTSELSRKILGEPAPTNAQRFVVGLHVLHVRSWASAQKFVVGL
jgi:hypothetical protein